MSISRILAELAIATRGDSLSISNREAAAKMLLDTCGCAYCGSGAPGIADLIALERELAAFGKGSVYFSDVRLSLPSAAFCNSAMIHALDFDNNYADADLHILSIVVPVALACCEQSGESGRRCMDGIILGVEVAARIAKPYIRAKRKHSYFLTTSLVGGWGGVAAAARLLNLTVEQAVHALGIYYAHTSGNRQALLERTLTKRIQPAIAAKAALFSVLLAQRGITGPEYVFEGKGGFYRCYTEETPPGEDQFLSSEIGAIEELGVKQFPTCGIHHANIVSALHLKREHRFKSTDIELVEFFLREGGGTLVSMPFSFGHIPQIDAQFCAPYAIALALHKGEVTVSAFTTQNLLRDQATAELAQRTNEREHFADMRLKSFSEPRIGCTYTKVTLRDGRVLEHENPSAPLNHPASMGLTSVKSKFRNCLAMYGNVAPSEIERMMEAILKLEHASCVSQWVKAALGASAFPGSGKVPAPKGEVASPI